MVRIIFDCKDWMRLIFNGLVRGTTDTITGHCGLRKYLRAMGIYDVDPICRLCRGDDDTAAHILFNCEALATRHVILLRNSTLPGEASLEKTLVKELLLLVRGMGFFD